ncbi:hypothetical protein ACH40F_32660 [Streptomyces sp. NPDC020794]|uniref:hypothetical protein n=1 Tax=unclassified Streptomyces TaxID=2593676 RepID=UPI0036E48890
MAVGSFTLVTNEFLPVGLLSDVGADLHVSEGTAGAMITAPGITAAISALVLPVLPQRVNRRAALLNLSLTFVIADVYTAVHPQWGRLDASLDDLGCDRAWSGVHRVKDIELTCPECRGRVFARISQYRLRHFYHQVRPPDCELANESAEHHLLKLELAMAARAAGWSSELEVSSQSRD